MAVQTLPVQRMIVILVKRRQEERDDFSAAVPTALREYADAVEKDTHGKSDIEEFKATNGCQVLVVAGGNSVSG